MIKSLTVTNRLGESVKIDLRRPDKSGFLIKRIDGLGPVKANIFTTKWATHDGAKYNSARLDSRNITIDMEYYQTATESIEDLRHKSYRYFPEEEEIQLTIETDTRKVKIDGVVEHNDVDIFSANEGANISILCPDPYFYSVNNNLTSFSSVESVFEFPFSNESLTDSLVTLSEIKNDTTGTVYNLGDIDIGAKIMISAKGPANGVLTVYNADTGGSISIDSNRLTVTPVTVYGLSDFPEEKLREPNKTWYGGPRIQAVPGTPIVFSSVRSGAARCEEAYITTYDADGKWIEHIDTIEEFCLTSDATYIIPESVAYFSVNLYMHYSTLEPDPVSSTKNIFSYTKLLYPNICKGDLIIINTQFGEKSVTLLRDGVHHNIMECVVGKLDWITLRKGANLLVYDLVPTTDEESDDGTDVETGIENLSFLIENKVVYRGI